MLVLALLFSITGFSADEDFSKRVKILNDRFSDFNQHYQDIEKRREEIQTAAESHKKKRLQYEQQREKSRRQFIKSRTTERAADKFENSYLESKDKRRDVYLKRQRRFAKQRLAIEKIEEEANKVPLEKVIGLDDYYDFYYGSYDEEAEPEEQN